MPGLPALPRLPALPGVPGLAAVSGARGAGTTPRRTRRVAIVGTGFSGIGAAVALRRAGHDRIALFERGDDVGGVWARNTYPGAACDVPSYVYSFSFAQRRDWSRPCSPQSEVHAYLRRVAHDHGVLDDVHLDTEIVDATWDEQTCEWTLRAADGREFVADVLVPACGQLTRPAVPDVPGAERFGGPVFHSAEWDHDVDLAGRRVAVVGTGASAVQFVPPVAEAAAHVDVYQRSAPYLLPRSNTPYPRVVREVVERVPGVQTVRREGGRLLLEGLIAGFTVAPPARAALEAASRAFMRLQVPDPELRARTRPDYPLGCKRMLFSSAYLPALGRDDVELVTDEIDHVTERGIVTADGRQRPADVLVWGTGFRTRFVAPMRIRGRGGRDLADVWGDAPRAHHGITVASFPNMFLLYGPNTNLGVGSVVEMIEAQAGYLVDALARLDAAGADAMDVEPTVMAVSDARVQERLHGSIWTRCDSWYRTEGGRVSTNWPGFMREYAARVRRVRTSEYAFWSRPGESPDAGVAAVGTGGTAAGTGAAGGPDAPASGSVTRRAAGPGTPGTREAR
ncbi:NAD(P)/FAD-dependent oxidoreductase [Patulibacter sp.]|uniref:flavin-containing monooxygenase n=1 Tax=Patulibacter sp. TaxID=1912859 RepID=UPI00271F4287|nr:NAD(P)/FAD-dependent oxidoreductase [Patulibacter sp.]MDO9408116.1 NAD(P)/FAD-dependent oxidoreductase [Patulibacter sp.]